MLAIYLGTSPIYWLPGIGQGFSHIKLFLFLLISILVFVVSFFRLDLKVKKGIYGIGGVTLLIVGYAPALTNSTLLNYVDAVSNPIFGLVFANLIFNYLKFFGVSVQSLLFKSMIVLLPFLAIPFLASLGLIPTFVNPFNGLGITETGFTGARTGWSNSLALLLPIFFINSSEKGFKALALILLGLVLFNQYTTGGRAGLLVTLFFLGYILYKKIGFLYTIILLSLFIIGFQSYNYGALLNQLRIEEIRNGVQNLSIVEIDRISSGRIGGYLEAFEYIKNEPIKGNSIGEVKVFSLYNFSVGYDIHNLPLRIWAEAGILAFITYLTFHLAIIKDFLKKRKDDIIIEGFFITVIGGVFISMFEPSAYWLVFQNSAIWWMGIGYLIYLKSK